jgi:MFS family permease
VNRLRLRRTTAFWLLALTLGVLLFASSVPSPLYPVYQAEWHFSAVTLTSVFAVYAIALLAALLTVGSISDHLGRRPTLLAALSIEILAMLAFANADGVGWLFIARTLQGIATGTAMGALSAALLDLQPAGKPWLGGLMGAVAPMSGLACGALAAGLLVQYAPDPTGLPFQLLVGSFVVTVLFALAAPETVTRNDGWRRSLAPRLAVPAGLRAPFVASLPALVATWALGGLVLALGASLMAGVLGQSSHFVAGLPIFVMAGISAVASVLVRDVSPSATARGGLAALIAGLAVALIALGSGSSTLFLIGSAICGVGFGPAFAGVFRVLSTSAPVDQRASFVSSIFAVSYVAFSVPAVAAGIAVTQLGLLETAQIYGGVLIALAMLALALSGRLDRIEAADRAPARARARAAVASGDCPW